MKTRKFVIAGLLLIGACLLVPVVIIALPFVVSGSALGTLAAVMVSVIVIGPIVIGIRSIK